MEENAQLKEQIAATAPVMVELNFDGDGGNLAPTDDQKAILRAMIDAGTIMNARLFYRRGDGDYYCGCILAQRVPGVSGNEYRIYVYRQRGGAVAQEIYL